MFHGYVEQYTWRTDPKIYTMNCPECGAPLKPDDVWLKKGSNSWYTLCQCPRCTGSGNAAFQAGVSSPSVWFASCVRSLSVQPVPGRSRAGCIMLSISILYDRAVNRVCIFRHVIRSATNTTR